MKKEIILKGRGITHKLIHLEDNKYQLKTDLNYRVGFTDGCSEYTFIDPAGGPFMAPGDEIEGKKIKAIHDGAIIEFES